MCQNMESGGVRKWDLLEEETNNVKERNKIKLKKKKSGRGKKMAKARA